MIKLLQFRDRLKFILEEWLGDLAAVVDRDFLAAGACARANSLDGTDNIHAGSNLAEHDVLELKKSIGCYQKSEIYKDTEGVQRNLRPKQKCKQYSLPTFPSRWGVFTVVTKNWDPLVPGPALAMERSPIGQRRERSYEVWMEGFNIIWKFILNTGPIKLNQIESFSYRACCAS